MIGFAGGLNLYGYVGGNPVNWVDPLGLFNGLLPGLGPKGHHERNKYQEGKCPSIEPTYESSWYSEGYSSIHNGNSYRGIGSNRRAQCAYDPKTGKLIQEKEFEGTYDYSPPYNDDGSVSIPGAVGHAVVDFLPWVLFGN